MLALPAAVGWDASQEKGMGYTWFYLFNARQVMMSALLATSLMLHSLFVTARRISVRAYLVVPLP
jgi:hypothetical protein